MHLDFRDTDTVVMRMNLRKRDGGEPLSLDLDIPICDLPLDNADANFPMLDNEAWNAALAEDFEAAMAMLDELQTESDQYVAAGGQSPPEVLAAAVVKWVVDNRPGGHLFSTDENNKEDAYILSTDEINIHGPIDLAEGQRVWRVTAVGTWGE